MQKRWLVSIGLFVVLGAGGLVATCFSVMEDEQKSRVITSCRTPLVKTDHCAGFNDSWIECRWAFRAEGQPDRTLCERFMRLPRRRGVGSGPTDYDDVDAFSESPCDAFDLPAQMRCFTGTRSEHEATHRYLQAFDGTCEKAIVLRSCNQPLQGLVHVEEPSAAVR